MTCIVGITDGTTVTIGGDSAGSDGWHVAVRSDSKVFQVGPYLMGFTTSYRMGQLLRYSLTSHERAVMALEAAAELTEGVRPPFTVVQSA
ncbi:hypothetical protein ACQP2X_41330 [Actinoplanes sp. CA-131856]